MRSTSTNPVPEALREEGQQSLQTYLELCTDKGMEPFHRFSGGFNVRLDPDIHVAAATAAAAESKSLNEWVADAVRAATRAA